MIPGGALGIDTTPFQAAGVQAVAVRADLGVGALRVVLAADADGGPLDGHTVARGIGHGVAGTLADHGAQRQGVQDVAGLLRRANVWGGAGICAPLVDAGQP